MEISIIINTICMKKNNPKKKSVLGKQALLFGLAVARAVELYSIKLVSKDGWSVLFCFNCFMTSLQKTKLSGCDLIPHIKPIAATQYQQTEQTLNCPTD